MSRRREADTEPHSRLFVVCGKDVNNINFDEVFSKFGPVTISIPKDHNTGQQKGVAFAQFTKTSHAAAAIEALSFKRLEGATRSMKIMVAADRSGIQNDLLADDCKRLFITVPKSTTEDELYEYFKQFGDVVTINIQSDRHTGEPKGFAYVLFRLFSQAAKAYEEADRCYRAIFAMPKREKRPTPYESNIAALSNINAPVSHPELAFMNIMDATPAGYTRVYAMLHPCLSKYQVERLFDLIPGMMDCQFVTDLIGERPKIIVTYSNAMSAAYAVQKLNNFEYPPGQSVYVTPDCSGQHIKSVRNNIPNAIKSLRAAMNSNTGSSKTDLKQLADAVAEASALIKSITQGPSGNEADIDTTDPSYCSVTLPPPKPLADINSPIAKRLFLLCQPQPPPHKVLRDIFCRFGNLINVYAIPNKTVGYASYATAESADAARNALHGAELCGIRTKVLEAEERPYEGQPSKRFRHD